jgi:hypothetical protein
MSVLNWENIHLENLTILSPDQISPKVTLFDIRYDKKELILQTPKVNIYEKPLIYTHKNTKYYRICICFYNYHFCEKTKAFIQKINDIEDAIVEHTPILWKNLGYSQRNKKFISSIKYNENKTKAYMYLQIQTDNGNPILSVFDQSKQKKDIEYIIPGSGSYNIIMLQNLWQKGPKMGLNWVLLQTKIYHPIMHLDQYLILDPDEENPKLHYHSFPEHTKIMNNVPNAPSVSTTIPVAPPLNVNKEEHPIYGKYIKMKRMGIPMVAIQLKLQTDGINMQDFLLFYQDKNKSTIVNSYTNPIEQSSVGSGLTKITPNMLLSVSLKKANPSNEPKKIKIENQAGFQAPSKQELTAIINGLKKIKT